MKKLEITEITSLEIVNKWEYLRQFYKLASKFYDAKDAVISDEEVKELIKQIKVKPEPEYRKIVNLKDWKFRLDAEGKGIAQGYFQESHDEKDWAEVTIPHSFSDVPDDPVLFGRTDYMLYSKNSKTGDIWRGEATAWYKTRPAMEPFNPGMGKYAYLNTSHEHQVAYLNVGSANLVSDVWVNETPVVFDHLGLFPYRTEITEALCNHITDSPVVAVRVKNILSNMPHLFHNGFQHAYFDKKHTWNENLFDWPDRADGGLAGDVTISVMHKAHIENVFIHTEQIAENSANIMFDLTVRNQYGYRVAGSAVISVSRWESAATPAICSATTHFSANPLDDTLLNITVNIPNPSLWTPDTPDLYIAHIILYGADGVPIDDIYETFGVRTFKMHGAHFYLNGKKIVLQGTHDIGNYHGESVIWLSDDIIVRDILLHKLMGANCSRWPSDTRMHCKRIAELCDQFGFMTQWAGYFEVWNVHPDMEMLASRDVGAMVKDLRNHASIVIWEMSDESLLCDNAFRRMKFVDMMYRLVQAADPTRPVVPAGFYCNCLYEAMGLYPEKDLNESIKARRVISENPRFNLANAPWDFHMGQASMLEKIKVMSGGAKAVVLTEFGGSNALPNPALTGHIYNGFHWKRTPFCNADMDVIDKSLFGCPIRPKDWRETQAMQALTLCRMLSAARQYPDIISAYFFVQLIDYWTLYCGVTDVLCNAKLAFFPAQNHFDAIYITVLTGAASVSKTYRLPVSLSNYGPEVHDAVLKVYIRNTDGRLCQEYTFGEVSAEGNVAVSRIAELDLSGLPDNLYTFEYFLYDKEDAQMARMFEMAYVEGVVETVEYDYISSIDDAFYSP
jgi:hypothetical protein